MPSIAIAKTALSSAQNKVEQVCIAVLSGLLTGSLVAFASVPAPVQARQINRGMEPAHQPVIQRTDFVFDVQSDGAGGLSSAEATRVTGWLDAISLGYGDRVSLANASGYDQPALRSAVSDLVARYGLLVARSAPITAGEAPSGAVRIVVSRSVASVSGCPTWRDKGEADFNGGTSDNYGCAMATNMAAMIADPQDLIEGRSTPNLRTTISSRAIKTYTEQAPTGAGGLKAESTGGK